MAEPTKVEVRIRWCKSREPGKLVADIVGLSPAPHRLLQPLLGASLHQDWISQHAAIIGGVAAALRAAGDSLARMTPTERARLVGQTATYTVEVH